MLEVEYMGGNGIVLATKRTKLLIDPRLSVVGLKDLDVKNAVQCVTEERFMVESPDTKLIIEGPGEYEVGDFTIRGIATTRHIDTEADGKKSTVYRLGVGDLRVAVLGNIAPTLTEEQLEGIGVVDILFIPVGGGGYTLDATSAAALTRQIDPKAIIPVHYADSGLEYEVPQESLDVFVKELGAPVETASKYKIKSASGLPAVMTIIGISRS